MTRDELIAKLHDARALVYLAHEGTDLPQIQMILRHADQNLHWALWNLGVVNSLRPDLPPQEGKAAAPKRKKPARATAKRRAPKVKARKAAKPKRRTTARGRAKRR
jgi:hypothetical protein